MKICPKCQLSKSATPEFFYRRRTRADGLDRWCKLCRLAVLNKDGRRKLYDARQHERRREAERQYRRAKGRAFWSHPRHRLRRAISQRIHRKLKGCARGRIESFFGYPVEDLMLHLERQFSRGMSWANYGAQWTIDHIIPLAAFDITEPGDAEFCAAWALPNLRPLGKIANGRKGARRELLL